MRAARAQEGVGVVEDEACGAHQMARVTIIDGAVIKEVLEEAALGIKRNRLIEGEDVLDMAAQEIR